MKVLVACEFSGVVREAFAARGHDAWSCDLLPTEQPGQHIQGDVLAVLDQGWDLMIAHPPCTYVADAGERWFKVQPDRLDKAREAFKFFMAMVNAPIPLIAVENPKSWRLKKWYRQPDDIIHPFHFGDPFTKQTWLWLKGLPPLWKTGVCDDYFVNWSKYKGAHNGKSRSKTFPGIAAAIAAQWG